MDPQDKDVKETQQKKKISIGGFLKGLPRDFLLGCLAFLPLALLVFITYYFFNLLLSIGRIFFGITDSRTTSATLLAIVIITLIYTGMKLRRKERWLLNFLEQAIAKIPVLGGWYVTFRDIVQTFTAGSDKNYLGTVAVPVGEGYIIGFITNREIDSDGNANVTVFVPTSPNPTTGLVFFYPEGAVKKIDLTPEQAFTRVISLGMKS